MKKWLSLTLAIGAITPILSSCVKADLYSPTSTLQSQSAKYENTKLIKKSNPKNTSNSNSLVSYTNNDSCGMFQTRKITKDYVTARHCIKRKFKSDSPVLASSGQAVKLTKPRKGNAAIITKHFNQAVQINVKVVEVNQCQAFFTIPRAKKPILSYIQSGDSGSPVVQYDAKKNPLVIGALSGGLVETKIRDVEGSRDAFVAGSLVYDDCNKYR
jgi:hypothetical protein